MIGRNLCGRARIGELAAFPDELGDEILLAEDFVEKKLERRNLVVRNADADHAVLAQELARHHEARIHHRQPGGVKASARLRSGGQVGAIAGFLAGDTKVLVERLSETVRIDEVAATCCKADRGKPS